MENWYALHLMSKQITREHRLHAHKLRLIQESRELETRNSPAGSIKKHPGILNFIGRSLETFGRALQKKTQTC